MIEIKPKKSAMNALLPKTSVKLFISIEIINYKVALLLDLLANYLK